MYVRSLSTAEELQRYVDFGQEVYRQNHHWVPPDPHHLTELLKGQGGFGSDSQVQAFWVEERDRVLATITDERQNRRR